MPSDVVLGVEAKRRAFDSPCGIGRPVIHKVYIRYMHSIYSETVLSRNLTLPLAVFFERYGSPLPKKHAASPHFLEKRAILIQGFVL